MTLYQLIIKSEDNRGTITTRISEARLGKSFGTEGQSCGGFVRSHVAVHFKKSFKKSFEKPASLLTDPICTFV